jgi:peptidoglycan/LPS O-acetylase OafA/YrhL
MAVQGSPVADTGPTGRLGSRYYRPELDALRFFAFLCVFFFHAGAYVSIDPVKYEWLSRVRAVGLFGVPIFFLLSAFLITQLLFSERERTGRIHIPSFYMRRILRIWPLYFTAFFGLAFLNQFWPGIGTDDPHAWIAFTLLCGNWYIFHHGWLAPSVDPLWSVSIEEQFYLIIPLLAARGGRQAVKITAWVLLALAYIAVAKYALHPNAIGNGPTALCSFSSFVRGR